MEIYYFNCNILQLNYYFNCNILQLKLYYDHVYKLNPIFYKSYFLNPYFDRNL